MLRSALPWAVAIASALGGCGSTGDGDGSGTDDVGSHGSGDVGGDGDGDGCADEPSAIDAVTVHTTRGVIEGAAADDVVAFLGVPYAAPPMGALRFAPPVATDCWPEPRAALDFAEACVQREEVAPGIGGEAFGSEDCLYLNVWTPATGPGERAVMVFIHGGGNAIGTTAEPYYEGAALAAREDVVVVTLQYRLGALGWLTHPGLDDENPDGVSGNYGLRDQLAALAWVRDNVAAFGGDPNRVMLFGESAGAVNTCAILGVPSANGLVHRAAIQSGACTQRSRAQIDEDMSNDFLTASGCGDAGDAAAQVACLRELDDDSIATLEPDGFPSVASLAPTWGPHVDGELLPRRTLDAMADGEHVAVPLLVGANDDETALEAPELDEAEYVALVQQTFGAFATQVLMAYPASDYASPRAAWIALTSDVKFVCNSRRTARAAATGGESPVFRYHFEYDDFTPASGFEAATYHGLDVPFVFGTVNRLGAPGPTYVPNASDISMETTMTHAWASFARDGVPALDSPPNLDWPEYDAASDSLLRLDLVSSVAEGVRTETCDFWDAVLP